MVLATRLELVTFPKSAGCSNQMNYTSKISPQYTDDTIDIYRHTQFVQQSVPWKQGSLRGLPKQYRQLACRNICNE